MGTWHSILLVQYMYSILLVQYMYYCGRRESRNKLLPVCIKIKNNIVSCILKQLTVPAGWEFLVILALRCSKQELLE